MFKVQIEHQSISLEGDLLCCESFKIWLSHQTFNLTHNRVTLKIIKIAF